MPGGAAGRIDQGQTRYVFEASEPEHERLVRMSRVMEPYVYDACTRLALPPGAKAIEFGCGPLGALLPLSNVVGSGGLVVGLDRSGEALDKARTILVAQQIENVRLVQADFTAMAAGEVCPPGPFDLAYCHFVLLYQRDVAAALRRMAAVVRPGGYIVAQEVILSAPIPVDAPGRFVPAANRLMNGWFPALLEKLGTRWDVAERFSTACRDAGLVELDQRVFAATLLPEQTRAGISIYHDVLAGVRPLLLAHGIAEQDEIDRVLGQLRAAQDEVYTATVFTHLQAELVAQVPDTHTEW
jgi:ubiquinone/menaquinone biosynthesis C-methylase UbiE